MKKLEEIKQIIKRYMPELKRKYKVKCFEIFGSYVREENKKGSDIDILVEFSGIIDLFAFIGLENFLSEKLGAKVDLVMKETLKPRIKDRILNEAVAI